jgi:hypothetical protein
VTILVSREDHMGAKIFLGICAAGEAFLVYCLYHFIKEGTKGKQPHPVVNIVVGQERRDRPEDRRKAA